MEELIRLTSEYFVVLCFFKEALLLSMLYFCDDCNVKSLKPFILEVVYGEIKFYFFKKLELNVLLRELQYGSTDIFKSCDPTISKI